MPHTKEYHRDWKRKKMEALRADPAAWAEHQLRKADYDKEYRSANRERRKEQAKEWGTRDYVLNKRRSDYRSNNPKKVRPPYDRKAKHREYCAKNRDKVRAIRRAYSQKQKAIINSSPVLKIKRSLRARLRTYVRGIASSTACVRMLGCTIDELKKHLESQFHAGMTWENYGRFGWHADHVRPISHFNLAIESERVACFHYTNLQPLWAAENCAKGNRKVYRVIERALIA